MVYQEFIYQVYQAFIIYRHLFFSNKQVCKKKYKITCSLRFQIIVLNFKSVSNSSLNNDHANKINTDLVYGFLCINITGLKHEHGNKKGIKLEFSFSFLRTGGFLFLISFRQPTPNRVVKPPLQFRGYKRRADHSTYHLAFQISFKHELLINNNTKKIED